MKLKQIIDEIYEKKKFGIFKLAKTGLKKTKAKTGKAMMARNQVRKVKKAANAMVSNPND